MHYDSQNERFIDVPADQVLLVTQPDGNILFYYKTEFVNNLREFHNEHANFLYNELNRLSCKITELESILKEKATEKDK